MAKKKVGQIKKTCKHCGTLIVTVVFDDSGNGALHSMVSVVGEGSHRKATGASNKTTFTNLPAGTYAASAKRGGASSASVSANVGAGEKVAVTLRLIDGRRSATSAESTAIASESSSLVTEYKDKEVKYQKTRPSYPAKNSHGKTVMHSDCSSYVADTMSRSGVGVPDTTTGALETSQDYELVAPEDARPGDVIRQGGHMGIYTGTDDRGRPTGNQMGTHGAAEQPWGPHGVFEGGSHTQYYRPRVSAEGANSP